MALPPMDSIPSLPFWSYLPDATCSVSSFSSHPQGTGLSPLSSLTLLSLPWQFYPTLWSHLTSLCRHKSRCASPPLRTDLSPEHRHSCPSTSLPDIPAPESHDVQNCTGIVIQIKLFTEALLSAKNSAQGFPGTAYCMLITNSSDKQKSHGFESRCNFSGSHSWFKHRFLTQKSRHLIASLHCPRPV